MKETLPDGTIIYNISPRIDTGIHVEKRVATNGTVTYVNNLYAGDYPLHQIVEKLSSMDGSYAVNGYGFSAKRVAGIIYTMNSEDRVLGATIVDIDGAPSSELSK